MKFLEVTYSAFKKRPFLNPKHRKVVKVIVISTLILVLLGILYFLISYPHVQSTYAAVKKTAERAKSLQQSLKDQDVVGVREQSILLQTDLKETKKEVDYFWVLGYIPILNWYYSDGVHLLNAGSISTEAAVIASDALIPFADSLGLRGGTDDGNAEEKASKLVQIMPKILPEIDVLQEKITQVRKEISPINPNIYPEQVGGIKIKSALNTFKGLIETANSIAPELKPILTILPSSLGDPKPKTYMVILQNDAEIRSTGGFITSVAYITLSKGRIVSVKSEDIYRLDERIRNHPVAPEQIRKYLKQEKLFLRDTNLSADFVVSMDAFNSLYQSSDEVVSYDGFIALDTKFVEKLLSVTGPVTTDAYGETFSADPSVNGISDVVYKLELYSQKLLRQTDDRKELLGDLLDSLMKTVLRSPTEKWQPLIQATIQSGQEKHLMVYSFDKNTQTLIEKYNLAGRIIDYDGDYLHVNENNYGGLKSNLFVNEVFEQEIDIGNDGEVTKTVKIHLNNPFRDDGWLNGTYNDYLRLYVPQGSKLDKASSSTSAIDTSTDFGKTVFTTFVSVGPESSKTVEITYKLPFKVKKGQPYKMMVQKQPGAKSHQMIVKINGNQVENTKLATDKEFSFKIP